MQQVEEEKGSKAAEQNRKRQNKFREKQKAVRECTYQISLLDQAKADLKFMEPMDLQALLEMEKYKDGLPAEDIERLKTFIKNRNRLIKMSASGQSEREREELSNQQKAQRLSNQLIPELHSAIMKPQTENERKMLVLEKIRENLFTFLEFMETKLDTSNEFLKLIVDLQVHLDNQTFSKLFILVCANYQCNNLEIKPDMAVSALQFLTTQKQDRDAALGLLRLMYINSISLRDAEVDLLLQFQEMYELQVMSVFKSLQGPKMQVRESLPPTLFCFTPPVLASLKDGGAELHTQVPIQWLPYFISIICYSFISDKSQFDDFILTFKSGVGELYDQLKSCNFSGLLQEVFELTRQMQPKFFKSLAFQATIMRNAFDMVRRRTVTQFNDHIMEILISNDGDSLRSISQRPSTVLRSGMSQIQRVVQLFAKNNPQLLIETSQLERPVPKEAMDAVLHHGITVLLPVQHVCLNWVLQFGLRSRSFIQLETGQGKTLLCLAIATANVREGGVSIIINSSEELLFRDFKLASSNAQKSGLRVQLVNSEWTLQEGTPQILFSPPALLPKLFKNLDAIDKHTCLTIIDEFVSLLFDSTHLTPSVEAALALAPNMCGMTSSHLQNHHLEHLRLAFGGECINFNINLCNRQPPIEQGVKVFPLLKDYCSEVVQLAITQSKATPVVCIMEDQHEKIASALKRSSIPVLNLCHAEPTVVESSLKVFNEKQGENFPVALVNDSQGRGLDFRSSSDIEAAGGVFLIVGQLPKTFLQFRQYIGRTGRAGNKGQYSVILHDREAKGFLGASYLQHKLEQLKNEDLLSFQTFITRQRHSLQIKQDCNDKANQQKAPAFMSNFPEEVKEDILELKTLEGIENNSFTESDEGSSYMITKIHDCNDGLYQPSRGGQGICRVSGHVTPEKVVIPKTRQRQGGAVSPLSCANEIDRGYFDAYSKLDIHNEMLNDKVRMGKYKEAIEALCKDKIVIDVGAGTAILSCMAAKAGAKQVHALENSEIVHHAQKMVRDNKLQHIVKITQGAAEEFEIEGDKADVIISEWMGYMLLFEKMLPSVLKVRDRCLKEGGIMVPSSARILLAAMAKPESVADIDLTSLRKASFKQAVVIDCRPEWVISDAAEVFAINMATGHLDENSFSSDFQVTITRECTMTAIVLWFDTLLAEGVTLSTSPLEEPTHWHQTVLTLKDSRKCESGTNIKGTIMVKPQHRNHRALRIDLGLEDTPENGSIVVKYMLDVA